MLPHLDVSGVEIPSYLLLLISALIVGSLVAVERGRRDGLPARGMALVAILAALAGVVGARGWSLLLEHWPLYDEVEGDAFLATSGLGLFGGLVLGGLAAAVAARACGLRPSAVADAMTPGVSLGIAVGRVGCLLSGCCFGRPTLFPIALVATDFDSVTRPLGLPRHPAPVYESALTLALAVALWKLPCRPARLRLGALLAGYGAIRLLVEPLRDDYRGWIAGLPTTTLAAGAAGLLGAVLIVAALRHGAVQTPQT